MIWTEILTIHRADIQVHTKIVAAFKVAQILSRQIANKIICMSFISSGTSLCLELPPSIAYNTQFMSHTPLHKSLGKSISVEKYYLVGCCICTIVCLRLFKNSETTFAVKF